MSDNTIFDDVFRTMLEKMTFLVVPLINEVFHTSYPEDIKITQLRNEYQQKDGEIITDSRLLIGDKIYHIECQSKDDMTMSIRMIEYDFAIAIEIAQRQGRRYQLKLPYSCVLYLRSTKNTPDFLETEIIFPDGKKHLYRVPTVKLADYTKDDIFEKNLLMLLPFYIMRYEKKSHEIQENPELFQGLLNEFESIRVKLEEEITETGKSELYVDLIKLIIRISDYIFKDEETVRKGVGKIMGGHVLELESERRARILAEEKEKARELGLAEGRAEGITQGKLQGEQRLSVLINRLILDGRSDEISKVVTDRNTCERMYEEYHL